MSHGARTSIMEAFSTAFCANPWLTQKANFLLGLGMGCSEKA
jgi:hypothetical protein